MTASATSPDFFAKSENKSDEPVGLPTEEEIALILCEARSQMKVAPANWTAEMAHIREMEAKHPTYITGFSTGTDALRQARALLALIRQAFEAKEQQVRQLVALLDKQMGTPCEQIRHQQEADDLREQIKSLTEKTKLPVIADYIEVQDHSRAMEARALTAESERDALKAKLDAAEAALKLVAEQDVIEIALDPDWPRRICAAATRAQGE